MKKIEITLDDNLHRKLEKSSQQNSKSIDRLIQELLIQSIQNLDSAETYSVELLAEGYQTMIKENSKIVEESMGAQMIALKNQSEEKYDSDS